MGNNPGSCGFSGGSPSGGGDDPYSKTGMEDVGGLEEQKEYLRQNVLRHLQGDNKDAKYNLQPPKGVLFYGAPGTGKTLLARAFGNDLSTILKKPVRVYHQKGGDLLSKWLGESGRMIRELFRQAKAAKPSLIFLDELDGICPNRENAGHGSSTVVSTFLAEMDDLVPGEVFVFAATNRISRIDSALLRPGRFDKHLEFFPPSIEGRMDILRIYTKKWPRSKPNESYLRLLASSTAGMTGADLDQLCREVFLIALARNNPNCSMDIGIENLEILQEDWNVAIRSIKPSKTQVFGSALYIPQQMDPLLIPLIQNNVQNLLEAIKHTFRTFQENSGGLLLVQTFYVSADKRSIGNPDESLENLILPSVFEDAIFKDYPIYRLTKLDILCEHNTYKKVETTLDSVAASVRPSILFLPRIDAIAKDLEKDKESGVWEGFVGENLLKLRGKQVLVVATGGYKLPKLPLPRIRNIFSDDSRCFSISQPTAEERRGYFKDALRLAMMNEKEEVPKTIPRSLKKEIDALQETIVKVTAEWTIPALEQLKQKMNNTCVDCFSFKDKSKTLHKLKLVLKDVQSKHP